MNPTAVTAAWARLAPEARVARPRSEADYLALVALLDRITDELAVEGRDVEGSSFEALFDLAAGYVEAWENEHDPPIPDSPPHLLLAFLMEQQGLKQGDLAALVNQGDLSKILAGKRGISKALAKKLGTRFGVSPAMFL